MTHPDRHPGASAAAQAGRAKWLLVLLAFAWGLNWSFVRIALEEVPPWTLRFVGIGMGTGLLFLIAWARGVSLAIPRGQRLHVALIGLFNVAAFNILAALAQMATATSRVVIIVYSMPIWASVLSYVVLGERLNAARIVALLLCAAGLSVLVGPLLADGFPLGALFASGCALSWAIGTIYLKWAKIAAPPLAVTGWQLLAGWLVVAAGMVIAEGAPQIWPIHWPAAFGVFYGGVIGVALAYMLWFMIIERLPAMTASLGALMVPVVGVLASSLILGERPTLADMIGFALIFAAAASVILAPAGRPAKS